MNGDIILPPKARGAFHVERIDMISKLLQQFIGDLINAKDGSISMTRLASCTAHGSAAFFFVWHNFHSGFSETLWGIYLGATILHAGYDKTLMLTKGGKPTEPSPSPQ